MSMRKVCLLLRKTQIADVFSASQGFMRSSRAVYAVSALALMEYSMLNFEVLSRGLGFRFY